MEKDSKGNQKLFFGVLKLLRKEKSGNTKQIKNKTGDILREEKEIMDKWKEYFEELLNVKCERQTGDDEEAGIKEQKEEMRGEGMRIEEVIETVRMLKRGEAAEHDNITAEMLQNMGENGFEMLTELFNKIWEEERIPKDWEVGIVIPLFKKGDISNCSNYREITLLSCCIESV